MTQPNPPAGAHGNISGFRCRFCQENGSIEEFIILGNMAVTIFHHMSLRKNDDFTSKHWDFMGISWDLMVLKIMCGLFMGFHGNIMRIFYGI